ncbi:alpha/beta hydrolase [Sphingomonas sp. So64.6b]|uniref:alpha/beta fold hydrolase n=1 Tax=Sphingomonas sp. So64.6b TaxID=2997354 RepID=UPI0015FFEEA0|nr:alpha/beta hydrolase [Sphingomonas sp. So64.6b]QNA86363.1 alpha/beta hydrolase [Sphingomonas sp. So64.6b]
MATFILVPGGWQGGWVYEAVASILEKNGHKAVPMTVYGLPDCIVPAVNLDSHIAAAIDVARAQIGDVILAGQSYGGMVIAGAADAVAPQIRALVYVDAYVPDSGDSVWSLTTPAFRELFVAGAAADGINCVPPPGSDQRCRAQPIGTFLQTISLSGRWREVQRKTFVCALGWEGSPFRDLYSRLSDQQDWQTVALDCGHNIARLEPEKLAKILLARA